MADATDKRAMLAQCLLDIGYDKTEVEMLLVENAQTLLQSLTERKQRLLKDIHRDQKCVDCLDYLVYQIRRGSL